jgi:hypothetical protein
MKTSIACVAVFMLFMALSPAHAYPGGTTYFGPVSQGAGCLATTQPSLCALVRRPTRPWWLPRFPREDQIGARYLACEVTP